MDIHKNNNHRIVDKFKDLIFIAFKRIDWYSIANMPQECDNILQKIGLKYSCLPDGKTM